MKYIAEFNDSKIARGLLADIKTAALEPMSIMEVCGTHTMAIFKSGIRSLLPPCIKLISGPGCPVCVTDQYDIDRMIALSKIKNTVIATFGDMVRVPGTDSSLEKERASGADIRPVYSPLDALEIARCDPSKQVIFLAVGFETTAPATASTILDAAENGIGNFMIYCCHKTIPEAMNTLLAAKEIDIDGFLCPGHVSSITGTRIYEFIPKTYNIPCCIAGFEPVDILESILTLVRQSASVRKTVSIQYKRAVQPEGNLKAQEIVKRVFDVSDAKWRGLGDIPASSLSLRDKFSAFDAARRFKLPETRKTQPGKCLCGQILRGLKTPAQCPLFAKTCTPENPYGPCMVSSEGTCAAWFRYNK